MEEEDIFVYTIAPNLQLYCSNMYSYASVCQCMRYAYCKVDDFSTCALPFTTSMGSLEYTVVYSLLYSFMSHSICFVCPCVLYIIQLSVSSSCSSGIAVFDIALVSDSWAKNLNFLNWSMNDVISRQFLRP